RDKPGQRRVFRRGAADRHDGLRQHGSPVQVHPERRHHRMTTAFLLEALTSVLIIVGGAFALLGSIGLARLPDFLTRLHGPTKATTLGVGALLIGSMVHLNSQGNAFSLRELAITLFL